MRTFTGGLLVFLAAGGWAIAHHGLAAFDRTTEITLEGTVTEFHFVNPHCIVDFEVKDGWLPPRLVSVQPDEVGLAPEALVELFYSQVMSRRESRSICRLVTWL